MRGIGSPESVADGLLVNVLAQRSGHDNHYI
jgi:hypothetical protein